MKDFNEFDPDRITEQYAPPPSSHEFDTPEFGNRNRIIAVILAIFLGSLGVHNFYLGFTKKAVIQLVLTLLGITAIVSGIWMIVDVVAIISNPNTFLDADGKKLR